MSVDKINMVYELVESVDNNAELTEDTRADTLVWLREHLDPDVDASPILWWMTNHDRCWVCGSKFRYQKHREWHEEVQEFEVMNTRVCPNCDDERGKWQ